ncbi:MAG TPA: radical SAM protein [Feifaniaceae bacterium]|nr:radical SAM protein [Feifaniaceae bacterium]
MSINPNCAGENLKEIVKQHPCFSAEAHYQNGRIHLPVSPDCNIRCKFCVRSFNRTENRPGVAQGIVSPEKAADILEKAIALCPELTVVGIAGPGDTLATPHAIETFALAHEKHPELLMCLSTNGLLLERHAARLAEVGVKTVTVTVNAVDPDILKEICACITLDGVTYTGREAAERLIAAQKRGIAAAVALGMVVKVNTVLIPKVNDAHIAQIAKTAAELGALMYNIIPLIPQGAFAHTAAPDCVAVNAAREAAEPYITVFRHCQHCRADACGIPGRGNDIAKLLYGELRAEETFSHG